MNIDHQNCILLGKGGATKSDEFLEKFNPKIYFADFGNFKQGFLSMKLIQKSNIWVQDTFSNNCIEKRRHTLKAFLVIPGTGQGTKTDQIPERFQTAVDPYPPAPAP